ncbi:MAG: hypothetical protein KDJ87_15950 [Rhizobiaceae bacterium]|nr:hypothetical protein [Rhizobiaceae bacterium]
MSGRFSERCHDRERSGLYAELIQSSFDRPQGMEQAVILDRLSAVAPVSPPPVERRRPRLVLRWFTLPRFPLPFLTWA